MITKTMLEQMIKVRDSGFANMFSYEDVIAAASRLDLKELFDWLLINKKHYGSLLSEFIRFSYKGDDEVS